MLPIVCYLGSMTSARIRGYIEKRITVPGNLVQAPCLFVGRTATGGDELRLAWEWLVGLSGNKFVNEAQHPSHVELGACTLSGPVSRLLFEDPTVPQTHPEPGCLTRDGELVATIPKDPKEAKNIPNSCRFYWEPSIELEAVLPREVNPDALCPALNDGGSPGPMDPWPCDSEHFDGTGYPNGLSGEEIPLGARIIHVADALDSMLTTRIYRAARPADEALEELRRGARSQFCPRCVSALERLLQTDEHGESEPPSKLLATAS